MFDDQANADKNSIMNFWKHIRKMDAKFDTLRLKYEEEFE